MPLPDRDFDVTEVAVPWRILTAAGMTVRADGNYLLVEGAPEPADVTRRLAHQELYVSELVPVRADLESVFLELTEGEGL